MKTARANQEQSSHWAGVEGDNWVENAAKHDRMLAPFADQLATATKVGTGDRVLDIGCGCGVTSLAAAGRTGSSGAFLGVDLSPQMLRQAGDRAAAAGVRAWTRFEVADAQVASLGTNGWDEATSRFGVIFFDDPIAALTSIAGSLRRGGGFVFCCWQALYVNHWMSVPGFAVAQHLTSIWLA